jgi:glutamyl-tRNA synthetase
MLQGTCILRYDDTNPSNVIQAHVDQYVEDMQLLGLSFDQTSFASDYFPQLHGLATDLIRAGKMYADCTPKDQASSHACSWARCAPMQPGLAPTTRGFE